ncbi:MAG: HypC/HybG/HupF family hydrogenase formation chaperone [Canidatus Methanoxibalbensis ujae]|nr:HypC/HybG/HupF family hydrogenase formation chaperone [Candidatus Methanoxibalbensis ujae]MCW7077782.1 HypC/HybG/HupF family hydrogenase formation chaperone [Candidatus Methanoxibalbensis ujae]RLG36751.1 MAG: HypC/HybG/HupF family hydrogenase formation chaperone [Methanosarcinales archaeon]
MCLGIPARIVKVKGERKSLADFGGGVMREIDISLVDVREGEYVIVHAGFAISVIDEEEAEETMKIWRLFSDTETSELR